MLIHVLNIKLTCEWHEAIKLSYKKSPIHIIVVVRVSKLADKLARLADADITWRQFTASVCARARARACVCVCV
jgi:hypothetical protein